MFYGKIFVVVLAVIGSAALANAQVLSPQQQRLLADATTSLDQSEKLIRNLEAETKSLKVGVAGTTPDKTQALLADRDKAVGLINTANTRFRQLPLANADVRAQYDRVKPLRDSLMASDKKLVEVHNELAKGGAQPSPAPPRAGAESPPRSWAISSSRCSRTPAIISIRSRRLSRSSKPDRKT